MTCWQLTYEKETGVNWCPYDDFWGMTVMFPFGLILLNIFLGVGLINISGVVIAMHENNYWYLLISSPIFIIFGISWPFWAVALSGV
jgi:hypothetical protein